MLLMLHPDESSGPDTPTVDLRLITNYHDRTFWEFEQNHRRSVRTTFGQNNPLQGLDLPLHTACPTTSLAYKWLARDLAAVGWLKDRHRSD
jgi:hypothetical protein